jgi:hypothetical protein
MPLGYSSQGCSLLTTRWTLIAPSTNQAKLAARSSDPDIHKRLDTQIAVAY